MDWGWGEISYYYYDSNNKLMMMDAGGRSYYSQGDYLVDDLGNAIMLAEDASTGCDQMITLLDATDVMLDKNLKDTRVTGLVGLGNALVPAGIALVAASPKLAANSGPAGPVVFVVAFGGGMVLIGGGLVSVLTGADIQAYGLKVGGLNHALANWKSAFNTCVTSSKNAHPGCTLNIPGGFPLGGGGALYSFGPVGPTTVSKYAKEVDYRDPDCTSMDMIYHSCCMLRLGPFLPQKVCYGRVIGNSLSGL